MTQRKTTETLEAKTKAGNRKVSRSADEPHVIQGDFKIVNERGMHSRPSALFVQVAKRYDADVQVYKVGNDSYKVDGKSIMGVTSAWFHYNSTMHVRVSGNGDAQECFDKLRELVASGFEEIYYHEN